ncbi:hypothetical protein ACFLS9_08665 [Bacteroidota bacterium]
MKPEITAIILCGTSKDLFNKFINSLITTQPIEIVELILIVPPNYDYIKNVNANFHSKKQFMLDNNTGLDEMRVFAVKEASSELILFLVDHIFFEGDLINHLLKLYSHNQHVCICWAVLLANDDNPAARTDYIVDYIDWGKDRPEGIVQDFLPIHNNLYSKAILLELEDNLIYYMRSELTLHRYLISKGHKLYFTNQIHVKHYSYTNKWKSMKTSFWFNWNSADAKQKLEKWKLSKRLFYALAIQIKPILRWYILLNSSKDKLAFTRKEIFRHSFAITLLFFSGSVGEGAGHIFGTYKAPLMDFH